MIPAHIIEFKSDRQRFDFEKVSPRLQALILAAGAFMYFRYDVTLVVTGLLRKSKKSVHGWGNGVDFRTHNLTDEQGDALVKFLKEQFPYYFKLQMPQRVKYSVKDERKPGTSEHWNGPHIHAQVNYRENE